jgi:cyclic pyranopterin phosphate synthase
LLPIKINMVPIRGVNDDEIAAFARLTLVERKEPWHVRFIELMPTGWSAVKDANRCVKTPEIMERVSTIGPLDHLEFKGRGPSRNYRIRGGHGIIGFISAVSHSFCYECSRLRMSAIGRLRPCLFSKTEIDLGGPLRQGADDAELARLFALAVDAKPEGNYLKSPETASLPTMPSIGG